SGAPGARPYHRHCPQRRELFSSFRRFTSTSRIQSRWLVHPNTRIRTAASEQASEGASLPCGMRSSSRVVLARCPHASAALAAQVLLLRLGAPSELIEQAGEVRVTDRCEPEIDHATVGGFGVRGSPRALVGDRAVVGELCQARMVAGLAVADAGGIAGSMEVE